MKASAKRADRLKALAERLDDAQLADLLEDANGTGSDALLAAARAEQKRRGAMAYQPALPFAGRAER